MTFYETPKIAVRETGARITATLDLENHYFLSSLYAIYPKESGEIIALPYLLGLLNSTLANSFMKVIALSLTEGAFTKVRTNQLARLPIRTIDFTDTANKARHERMVQLVEEMIESRRALSEARSDRDKNFYQSECASLDRRIDALVYELYDLTEAEIALVESV